MADNLFIKKLKIPARIGVSSEERETPQTLVIDVEMTVDFASAAVHDDLSRTVNYAEVVQYLIEAVSNSSYHLIETLATHLVSCLQQRFPITAIRLSVLKHPSDLPQVEGGVGVLIERC